MKTFLKRLIWLLMYTSWSIYGASESLIQLSHVPINLHDHQAIMRGAQSFAKHCMACHHLQYLKHNPVAIEAGIITQPDTQNPITWERTPPPDLSLIARKKGANWLYTYFHSFYDDPNEPTGTNNLLVPHTSMPNVFLSMQGTQRYIKGRDVIDRRQRPVNFTHLELIKPGLLTPAEFDQTTSDLTHFLVYAGDPHASEREHIGLYVLLFLLAFASLAYALKKAYWKRLP